MRIVHFSDIHIGSNPKISYVFDKRFIGSLNFYLHRKSEIKLANIIKFSKLLSSVSPDLIVCTGDITSISAKEEFLEALQYLMPIADNKQWKFVYIPGNHDLYVNGRVAKEQLALAFNKLNAGVWDFNSSYYQFELQGIQFFCDMHCRATSVISSSGYCRAESVEAFNSWLQCNSEKPKVLMGHYPLLDSKGRKISWRRKLYNSETYLEALQNGSIKLALCGHIHKPFVREYINGAMEVCSGSLTMKGTFSVIDYDWGKESFLHKQWQIS